jgi:16S rRNA (guanine966-N2)-methyltransferase
VLTGGGTSGSNPLSSSGESANCQSLCGNTVWVTPDALTVVELAAREELTPPTGFFLLDGRVYGAARLLFLRRG